MAEQVRRSLAAAAECLMSLDVCYPIIYVGPMSDPLLLVEALREAGSAMGRTVGVWSQSARLDTCAAVVCARTEMADASAALPRGIPLIVWGNLSPGALPAEDAAVVHTRENLAIELAHAGPSREAARVEFDLPASLAGALAVVLAPPDAQPAIVDYTLLGFDGDRPGQVAAMTFPGTEPTEAETVVARWAHTDADPREVVSVAEDFRGSGRTLVVVTDVDSFDVLRAAGLSARVVTRVESPRVEGQCLIQWPSFRQLWLGGTTTPALSDVVHLPPGTSLREGLSYVEVSGRSGSLTAWSRWGIGKITLRARDEGVVITKVEVIGEPAATSRAAGLAALDRVRHWPHVRMEIVVGGKHRDVPTHEALDEPVRRIGFHFARLDDERRGRRAPDALGSDAPPLREIVRGLVAEGLHQASRQLVLDAEREGALSIADQVLMGCLLADTAPGEAITRLRSAAALLATQAAGPDTLALQTEATLTALLLMVRTGREAAADAWATVAGWMGKAGTGWIASPSHAAIVLELAFRAGKRRQAREIAEQLLAQKAAEPGLRESLMPMLAAVVRGGA